MESDLLEETENSIQLLDSVDGSRIAQDIGDSEIPTDPSDTYFLTHCFVCQAVAKPDQVKNCFGPYSIYISCIHFPRYNMF